MSEAPQTDALSPGEREEVRRRVRDTLERSDSFSHLDASERRALANNLVRVVGYLADRKAGQDDLDPSVVDGPSPLARAQAEEEQPQGPRLVGQDFRAGAAREGAHVFRQLVNAVDFPKFVSGLIDGVFNSIVDASIRQMEAYSKMLEAVVKSVEDFARDDVSENEGRDFVRNRFPNIFELAVQNDQPSLRLSPDADEDNLPDFQAELGLSDPVDFDSEDWEQKIIQSSRLQLARMRQQQLATMVMMGINRIVVTDGKINAKVVFDVKAEDTARRADATSFDVETNYQRRRRDGNIWGTEQTDTRLNVDTNFNKTSDQESDARVESKAKLTGEVSVNFKSDFFPMERIASAAELTAVEEQSKR